MPFSSGGRGGSTHHGRATRRSMQAITDRLPPEILTGPCGRSGSDWHLLATRELPEIRATLESWRSEPGSCVLSQRPRHRFRQLRLYFDGLRLVFVKDDCDGDAGFRVRATLVDANILAPNASCLERSQGGNRALHGRFSPTTAQM